MKLPPRARFAWKLEAQGEGSGSRVRGQAHYGGSLVGVRSG